ncbi:MAG: site-specific DNA-methyltransferase, partial [Gammaproteobacteria bacterium]|nr:site-specific DNA-methyltransferase [Gammaproteobacteria bacterium]
MKKPYILKLGNCLDVLNTIPDNSMHSIVCDPPYELGFMGRKWDSTGIAYNVEVWEQCLRVLLPGGYLVAFGGCRTYHRMACAVEDAGFEIRDSLHWVFGSGFPKNANVSKGIDRHFQTRGETLAIQKRKHAPNGLARTDRVEAPTERVIVAPGSLQAQEWYGWGSALKPAHEPIVLARKPVDGTLINNVLTHGTGAINIDGCRVTAKGADATKLAAEWDRVQSPGADGSVAMDAGLKAVDLSQYKQAQGRWPPNLLFTHHPDCKCLGVKEGEGYTINRWADGAKVFGGRDGPEFVGNIQTAGAEEVWACVDGCPIGELNRQSGILKSGAFSGLRNSDKHRNTYGKFKGTQEETPTVANSGGASRFYPCFKYNAKVNKKERNAGCEHLELATAGQMTGGRQEGSAGLQSPRAGAGRTGGGQNIHPTVKP